MSFILLFDALAIQFLHRKRENVSSDCTDLSDEADELLLSCFTKRTD